MKHWRVALVAVITLVSGCAEKPVEQPLRSLERSGKSSFICVGPDGQGRSIDACPDYDRGENRLLALVTQTLRGEVAVVDITNETVLDADPGVPGFSFLPVGANPIDIASTPGGSATFVASAEVGRSAIYALPTASVINGAASEPIRAAAAWPACTLPSAPSSLLVLTDPLRTEACAPSDVASAVPLAEEGSAGRRKLAVTLPETGELWILDAEAVLNQPPGELPPCVAEVTVPLQSAAPAAAPGQELPPDLEAPATCGGNSQNTTASVAGAARPVDLAYSEGRLFIADQGVPLIHVVDVSDPCAALERPPLRPVSFEAPERTVLTKRVAVSPRTGNGEQFVYAIDDADGSVMVFDVTSPTTNPTPLVRPRAPRLPFEPADRIRFDSPARDVEFVTHDVPEFDPATGIAVSGTRCDPDPLLSSADPRALHRPRSNRTLGAGPRRLRGTFAMVALANGQIVVVDVDDWDAACRRPAETNPAATEDFRGCSGDPGADYSETVSEEASCSVVEPHRTRSATFVVTSSEAGVRAPTLRGFPRLTSTQGLLATDRTEQGRRHPKLLGVPFGGPWPRVPNPDAPDQIVALCGELWIGTSRFRTYCDDSGNVVGGDLPVAPGLADNNSVLLSFVEPRAHLTEDVAATYEGALTEERHAGVFSFLSDPTIPKLVLKDSDAAFCARGVQDLALTAQMASEVPLAPLPLEEPPPLRAPNRPLPLNSPEDFARRHVDYVQITSDFLPSDDPYWAAAEVCGVAANDRREQCETWFGSVDTPSGSRDLLIEDARQNHLLLQPRSGAWAELRDQLQCCFPTAISYVVRGGHQWIVAGSVSGFQHDVSVDPAAPPPPAEESDPALRGFEVDNRCMRAPECTPRKRYLRGRVIEISNSESTDTCQRAAGAVDPAPCPVGSGTDALACKFNFPPGSSGLLAAARQCAFENATSRFAIFRGSEPSQRDYSFIWQTTGGFAPLFADLSTAQSSSVLPQSLVFVPQLNQVAVADGATQGLVMIDLGTVAVDALYF
jgi:hypothetical protein